MMPIGRNLGGEGGVQKSPRQVAPAVKRSEENADEPSIGPDPARMSVQGEEEACRKSEDRGFDTLGVHEVPQSRGGSKVVPVRMAHDRDAVPARHPVIAGDHGRLVSFLLNRSSEVAEIPPGL
jgi:hypothetical protein